MCNRFRLEPELLPTWREYAGFDLPLPNEAFAVELFPKYEGLVVRQQDGSLRGDVLRWGVPSKVRGASGKMLEKRVTNVRNLDSPFWKNMLAKPEQRCLVPFTRFAEPKIGDGKSNWWFRVEDQPVAAFAGIWRESEVGRVFAFLTCKPNSLVQPLHPKAMPVILHPSDYMTWLTTDFDGVRDLAQPFPADKMALVSLPIEKDHKALLRAFCEERGLTWRESVSQLGNIWKATIQLSGQTFIHEGLGSSEEDAIDSVCRVTLDTVPKGSGFGALI